MLDRYEDDETRPGWLRRAAAIARPGSDAGRAPQEADDVPPRPLWRRALPLLILAGAAGLLVLLVATRPRLTPEPPPERVWTVETAVVAFADIRPQLQVFGEVVPARKVELRALVAGEIVETGDGFREGGIVATGDLLAAIDPFDYEAALDEARAQLDEARARLQEIEARAELERQALVNAREQLVIRQRDLDRALRLARSGNISQKTVDDRRLAVSQQEAAVDQRDSNVAVETSRIAQQEAAIARLDVGVRRAERDLANTQIVAPFTGFVGSVAAEQGKRVSLNDRLADLTDAVDLDVRFTLSDAQYGRIIAREGAVAGRDAQVLWQVGGRTLSYDATVERVGAEISAASGGVEAYARLETQGVKTPLRPGAFVEVLLPDTVYEQVARLPETALHEGRTVYVVTDGRLDPRSVEVAARAGGDVLVSGSLEAGERVLVTRFPEAGPGVRVEGR